MNLRLCSNPVPSQPNPACRLATKATRLCALCLTTILAGCSSPIHTGVTSADRTSSLVVAPRFAVYSAGDSGTADFFLTDIPAEQLDASSLPSTLTGTMAHLQLFLEPRVGKTPRNSNASTCTIEFFVIANGRVGMYGGGGFLQPRGRVGDNKVSATMRAASLAPLRHSDGFTDVLGPSYFDLSETFERNSLMSLTLRDVCEELSARATQALK